MAQIKLIGVMKLVDGLTFYQQQFQLLQHEQVSWRPLFGQAWFMLERVKEITLVTIVLYNERLSEYIVFLTDHS